MADVRWHPAAVKEHTAVPERADRISIQTAVEKLTALGDQLQFPHQSAVKGSTVRELRPRAGRSRWRAFYGRIGNAYVIAAVGPEAKVNRKGFERAVTAAQGRLAQSKEG